MLRRFPFQILVAFTAFCLGVGSVVAWLYYSTPEITRPEESLNDKQPSLLWCVEEPASMCFPGLSKHVDDLRFVEGSRFPVRTLTDNSYSDAFVREWYSKELAAMNEPALTTLADDKFAVYRFVYLRSFHSPISVRLETRFENGEINRYLIVKQLDHIAYHDEYLKRPNALIVNSARRLNEEEWTKFLRLLDDTCFWQMPTEQNHGGNDGAEWIVEAVKNRRYHIVDYWSPAKGNDYRNACLYLLKLSNLEIKEPDIY